MKILFTSSKKAGINMSDENKIKLAATRNVIMNKFSKAHANRLENENNLNLTMQPLLTDSSNDATSQLIATSTQSIVADNNIDDPNNLCERLKILLMNTDNVKHVDEINTIIAKLRELEILV